MKLFTNNPDFYPTPREVIERMMMGEDFYGKVILEPSAGSGNIVRYLQENGAREVIACEKDSTLRKLLGGLCNIIKEDFLQVTSEEISHVSYIIMNPPFSDGARHIIHAYEIAPMGCTVIALCNTSNLNTYSYSTVNKQLHELVELHGQRDDLENVFHSAERRTDVSVSMVKLYKQGQGEDEFADYFFSQVDEDAANANEKEGLMHYNVVRELVNRYVSACKMFDDVLEATERINETATYFDYKDEEQPDGTIKRVEQTYGYLPIKFGATNNDNHVVVTHDQYKKSLQKYYWRIIFRKLDMQKYATKDLRQQINRFIEQQSNVPFTMGNVYRVLDMVVQTSGQRMQKALLEAFDRICSFSAENSTAGETWKTNANYMVNKRFIVPFICQGYYYCSKESYPCLNFDSYSKREEIEDVVKALCFLTGRNYDEIEELREHERRHDWGEWFVWGFFRCRGYKKGTMHFEFLDEDVWFKFNYEVSRLRGWNLPKKSSPKARTKNTSSKETSLV